MNGVFADTSYYIALIGERDENHLKAVAMARSFHGQVFTTDFVLVEIGNWLSRTLDRPLFPKLVDMLDGDTQTTVLPATRDFFNAGRSLFARRMDKNWSLTDCISFVVMRKLELTEALTTDHHFAQAGFSVLLT